MRSVLTFLLILVAASLCRASVMVRSLDQLLAAQRSGGQCKELIDEVCPVGCNGRIGENALFEDRCGVCGGDGSTCGDDDDGGCDSTCIALAVGIPLGVLGLVLLACLILFLAGALGRRRRGRRRRRPQPGLTVLTNGQYRRHPYDTTFRNALPAQGRRRRKRFSAGDDRRREASSIRWTNGTPPGWGRDRGDKHYYYN